MKRKSSWLKRQIIRFNERGSSRNPSIVLGYHIDAEKEPVNSNFENYLELGRTLIRADEELTYTPQEILVRLGTSNKVSNLGYFCEITAPHNLLGEFNRENLEEATDEFIDKSGIPDTVYRRSNWQILRGILAPHGFDIDRRAGNEFYHIYDLDVAKSERNIQMEAGTNG
jgi:hypothetical protein